MQRPYFSAPLNLIFEDYGITGCGVFKGGIQNWKVFFAKNQLHSNEITIWSKGELSKIEHHFRTF